MQVQATDQSKIQNPKSIIEISPILRKELRGRMRTPRAHTILAVYLAIVSAMALFLYIGAAISAPRANSNNGSIGISLFSVLVGMQVVLVCFIAPALTVSAISSERERMTYDSLRATPLGARQIALGKLLSALGYVSLAVLATLPLFSIVFLLGGIELVQVLMALSVVLASAFLFTALGLFVSSRMRSTVGATILTYAITLGVVLGLPVLLLIGGSIISRLAAPAVTSIGPTATITPAMVVAGLMATLALSVSPITAIVISQLAYQETGNAFSVAAPFLYGATGNGFIVPSPFIILCCLYVLMGLALLGLVVRRIGRAESV
jgi:ABC-type transport system involved in multi-copper enzyme maturation permease subunit